MSSTMNLENPEDVSKNFYETNTNKESVIKHRTHNAENSQHGLANGDVNTNEDGSSNDRFSAVTSRPGDPDDATTGDHCSLKRLFHNQNKLLHRKQLPKHLQFNPYIETGYRPLLSAWGCFMSLFYFHNETVNIITHG